jgi:hypothetical protein
MHATTNSTLVWKRLADESQQSAKLLARISVGLLVLMAVVGGYAYTAHARYAELCTSIYQQAKAAESIHVKKAGREMFTAYCD